MTRAYHSKASIKGHPIHPMLVSFPIALYASGVVTLIAYVATKDTFWYRASMIALLSGAVMGALAAIPGVIDLFFGIPRSDKAARNTGIKHMGLNLLSLFLFAGSGLALLSGWRNPAGSTMWLPYAMPLTFSIAGLIMTLGAGYFGWKLVQTHHVGIAEPEDFEKPARSVPARL